MSRTREQAIADYIARRILENTRKRFSTLHSEALERNNYMTTNIQHPLTDAQIEAQKHAEHKLVLERIAELEKRVAELEQK